MAADRPPAPVSVAEWLDARCVATDGPATSSGDLHRDYLEHGGEEISPQSFGRRLSLAGAPLIRRRGRSFRALRVEDGVEDGVATDIGGDLEDRRRRYLAAYASAGSGDADDLAALDSLTLARVRALVDVELDTLGEEGLAQVVEICGSDGVVREKIRDNPRAEVVLRYLALLGVTGSDQRTTPASRGEAELQDAETRTLDWMRDIHSRTEAASAAA